MKKILQIAGSIYLGFSFGCISCVMPHFLLLNLALSADPTNASIWAGESFASALIAGVLLYVYHYRKKREHEDGNLWFQIGGWSFVFGAVLVGILLFIYSANAVYKI
ncbi:MAG: hypothetical protein J6X30_05140 [Clostridia bacterium]|nr:hypothetical protein [Clostridia bacterium]